MSVVRGAGRGGAWPTWDMLGGPTVGGVGVCSVTVFPSGGVTVITGPSIRLGSTCREEEEVPTARVWGGGWVNAPPAPARVWVNRGFFSVPAVVGQVVSPPPGGSETRSEGVPPSGR